MLTNKDIRVADGNIVINGDKYPLDGQSPETIMGIVEDNSDTTPTENSTAPITSGGVYTALGTKQDTLTFDNAPTQESTNPVTSGGLYTIFDNTRLKHTAGTPIDLTFTNGKASFTASSIGASMIVAAVSWGADASLSLGVNNINQGVYTIFNNSNPTFTGTKSALLYYLK